jgi:hypothetical protein
MRVRFSGTSPHSILKRKASLSGLYFIRYIRRIIPSQKNIKNSPFLILPLKPMCDNQSSIAKDWEKRKAEGEALRRTDWKASTEIKET